MYTRIFGKFNKFNTFVKFLFLIYINIYIEFKNFIYINDYYFFKNRYLAQNSLKGEIPKSFQNLQQLSVL